MIQYGATNHKQKSNNLHKNLPDICAFQFVVSSEGQHVAEGPDEHNTRNIDDRARDAVDSLGDCDRYRHWNRHWEDLADHQNQQQTIWGQAGEVVGHWLHVRAACAVPWVRDKG